MPYDSAAYEEQKKLGARRPNGALCLTRLRGKHLRVITLHCAGMKGKDIASQMGMTQAWVSAVLNDPLARALVAERFNETDRELIARATQVVAESMNDQDPAIALRAADMVFRAHGRYEKRADDKPTAEDIVARMLEIAKQSGTAEVTVRATVGGAPVRDPFVIEGEPL